MWTKIRPFIGFSALALLVGGLSSVITQGEMEAFAALRQPPLSPPGWVFPVVWTILYVLMGLASYLVWDADAAAPRKKRALSLYAAQLAVNALWPLLFFRLGQYLLAFFWLLLLAVLVWACSVLFRYISRRAGALLTPYLIWLAFAAYLNLGVYLLN